MTRGDDGEKTMFYVSDVQGCEQLRDAEGRLLVFKTQGDAMEATRAWGREWCCIMRLGPGWESRGLPYVIVGA